MCVCLFVYTCECMCMGVCVFVYICECVYGCTMYGMHVLLAIVMITYLPSVITHPHSQMGGFRAAVTVSLSNVELKVRDLIRGYKK